MGKLTVRQVQTLSTGPRLHSDGNGLYLCVKASGRKSWIFRYKFGKNRREMGLGSVEVTGLAEARELTHAQRRLLAQGIDPIDARNARIAAAAAEATPRLWGEAIKDFIASRRTEWRSNKPDKGKKYKRPDGTEEGAQEHQWRQSLEDHGPDLTLPVTAITTSVVLDCLRPLWKPRNQGGRTETATRVRGRIERIWDAEKIAGHVTGDNPARWKGHLEAVLPRTARLKQKRSHLALPYSEAPALYHALCERTSKTARATLFTLLTVARTNEVVGLRDLSEIDFNTGLWLIPGDRMKANVDHEIPLVQEALDLLADLPADQPPFDLSENAMLFFLQRDRPKGLGLPYTIHGLRSTFRDWVAEETLYSNEVAEMAIAHQIKNKAEAAYRRGKLRRKRILLMRDWLAYLRGEWVSPLEDIT